MYKCSDSLIASIRRTLFEKSNINGFLAHDIAAETVIDLIHQHEAQQPADVVERVARAIHDSDPEHGIYCWAKYGKTHYMPMARAAITAMGGAGPQLTDARPDASEVRGSVARPMEESPPANLRHVTPEEDAMLHKALLASVEIIHPVKPEALNGWPDNIVADHHDVTGKWVLHYLTDEQAAKCREALQRREITDRSVVLEFLRQIKRISEMSAGIMRDKERTGNWDGAEKVARQFDRLGYKADAAIELLENPPKREIVDPSNTPEMKDKESCLSKLQDKFDNLYVTMKIIEQMGEPDDEAVLLAKQALSEIEGQ